MLAQDIQTKAPQGGQDARTYKNMLSQQGQEQWLSRSKACKRLACVCGCIGDVQMLSPATSTTSFIMDRFLGSDAQLMPSPTEGEQGCRLRSICSLSQCSHCLYSSITITHQSSSFNLQGRRRSTCPCSASWPTC